MGAAVGAGAGGVNLAPVLAPPMTAVKPAAVASAPARQAASTAQCKSLLHRWTLSRLLFGRGQFLLMLLLRLAVQAVAEVEEFNAFVFMDAPAALTGATSVLRGRSLSTDTATPVADTVACPTGYYRHETIVYDCEPKKGQAYVVVPASAAVEALRVPRGAVNAKISVLRKNETKISVYDPESGSVIGKLMDAESSYALEWNHIKIAGSRGEVSFQGTLRRDVVLRMKMTQSEDASVVPIVYSHDGYVNTSTGKCASHPSGCSRFDDEATRRAVFQWSAWAQSQHFPRCGNPTVLDQAICDDVPQNLTILPFFAHTLMWVTTGEWPAGPLWLQSAMHAQPLFRIKKWEPRDYGAAGPPYPAFAPAPVSPGETKTGVNLQAVCLNLTIPCLLFASLLSLQTFSIRYYQPALAHWATVSVGVTVIFFGIFACVIRTANGTGYSSWSPFLFATSLIAWVVAFALGSHIFANKMLPWLDVASLHVYPPVDPQNPGGVQLMDTGRIVFTEESRLDLSKSWGFRYDEDVYCVAPIVSGGGTMSEYNFWAVGVNCCSDGLSDFACGQYSNPAAHAGLRLMHDVLRPAFQEAVKQAQASYSIKATHPILLTWVRNPTAEVNSHLDEGYRQFALSVCIHFGAQAILVACAAVWIAKSSR